jgi:cytoskeletal protein CcmA (bactofilin family)
MSRIPRIGRRGVILLIAAVVLIGIVPGVAAAEERVGGSVTVGENETVSEDLTAVGGGVIVAGTVDGDISALGGDIVIRDGAKVTGDVNATAGSVRINGNVTGDVTATSGSATVGESGVVGGSLSASAGSIVIAGSVDGDARLGAESITLGPTAAFGGDVEYNVGEDGEFTNNGADVAGTITQNSDLEVGGGLGLDLNVPDLSGPLFGIFGFVSNLVIGALLLLIVPGTSRRIGETVSESPLVMGAVGFGTLIGVPIALALVAITVVGIPITTAGLATYGIAIWLAGIYGRYAIGELVLSYTDVDSRWVALGLGVVLVAVLVRLPIPVAPAVFELLVVPLLGLGALATLTYRFIGGQRGSEPEEPGDQPTRL